MAPIWFPGMVHADDTRRRREWDLGPSLASFAAVLGTILALRAEGRRWICECGQIYLWAADASGPHTSQHLADPYSLTHVLHGIAFYWAIVLIFPRLPRKWGLPLGIVLECLWEVVENSTWAIERYREATIALGYAGDTILNSMSDIGMCAAGFLFARRFGGIGSIAAFLAVELSLALWIRDGLLLNILMLLYPIDAIRLWQGG